jgi:hypothetical protein
MFKDDEFTKAGAHPAIRHKKEEEHVFGLHLLVNRHEAGRIA